MKRVVEQASQLVQRPVDMDIIHVLPGDYVLDERGGIKNPQGMEGTSLSVEVQLVLAQIDVEVLPETTLTNMSFVPKIQPEEIYSIICVVPAII